MNTFLTLVFLFFIGSTVGWVIELVFRKFFASDNPEHKWVNPGFCIGPYLPIYGVGMCVLYGISSLDRFDVFSSLPGKLLLLLIMALAMTVIEYIAGMLLLKTMNLRLWDYRNCRGNINGVICPLFSLFWGLLGGAYYFLIHPHIISSVTWLFENLAFSFVVGMFFGIFIIDAAYSANLVAKLREFAVEHRVVIKYETLKAEIRAKAALAKEKTNIFLPIKVGKNDLSDYFKQHIRAFEEKIKKYKK